jgi:hypothetical protein
VIDYARIRLVATDTRRVVRGWLGATAFVARHLPGTFGVWLGATTLLVAAAAIYVSFRNVVPAATLPTIALMVLAQQVFALARTWLRVGLLGAEVEYANETGWRER